MKTGELLFEIDGRPYQAELARTEAELQRCEARLKHTTAEYERINQMVKQAAVSREELERATGARRGRGPRAGGQSRV